MDVFEPAVIAEFADGAPRPHGYSHIKKHNFTIYLDAFQITEPCWHGGVMVAFSIFNIQSMLVLDYHTN